MKTFLHLLLAALLGLVSLGAISTPAPAQTSSLTPQSIKFGVSPFRYHYFYGTPYTLTATATSGLPVTFTIVAGPATVNGDILTLTGTGLVTVAANQAGDATYAPARKVTRSFIAYSGFQHLSPFETIPNQVYGDTPFSIDFPVSSAGLPVTVTVVSGPATIQGDTITLTGVGIVKLQANQPGNGLYNGAPPVTTTFSVTALPVITSLKSVQGTVGKPFSYQITSTGLPTSYTLVGTLPAGLNFDSTTGLISGTPSKAVTINLIVGASATEGTGTAKIHVAIITNVPHLFVSNLATGIIAEYTTTGQLVNASLIRGLSSPRSLAIADGFLYVVGQSGQVSKYKTSGELVASQLMQTPNLFPNSVAVQGTNLFLGYYGGIGAYTTSGETLNPALVKGLKTNYGLAATDAGIFVTSQFNGNVTQFSATGVRLQNSLVKGLGGPTGLAVTDTNIYVLNYDIGTIGKYTLAGKPVNPVLATGLVQPQGIAVLGDTIFVTGGNNTVSTYSTTGGTRNPFFIVGLHTPVGIAIEAP